MNTPVQSAANEDSAGGRESAQTDGVQRYFDAASSNWADYYDERTATLSHLDLKARLAVATQMLNVACDQVERPLALLDAGCGTGEGTSRISPPRLKVVATDLSTAMLAKALQKYPSIRGCAADAVALPFLRGSFDVVLSLGVLEYIATHERAISEFHRVLKPGGTLIVSVPNRASWFRRLHRVERALTRPLRRVRYRLWGVSEDDAGLAQPFRHRSWTLAEARRLLQAAGFMLIEARLVTYGWRFPMAEAWPVNLAFCRWMNARCNGAGSLARHLACTAILRARSDTHRGGEALG